MAEKPDGKELITELGATELPGAVPHEGWIYDEPRTELRGPEGSKIFRRMADDDPVIGAILFALEMMLRHVEWTVVAKDTSDGAEEARLWAEEVLFQEMETPFGDHIAEALSMCTYGFAPFEIVFSQRDDGTLGIRKLSPRAQESVWRWCYNESGRLIGLEQLVVHSRRDRKNHTVRIPWYKLLNYRTTSRKDNPEGRSLLRTSYTTWKRKQQVEDAEGRSAVRSAGIVEIRIPGRYLDPKGSPDDVALGSLYKSLADALSQDQRGSVVLPSDRDAAGNPVVELKYTVADGRRGSDMSPIIERFDRRMAASVLADFIFLGHTAAGSYALADQKTNMFALGAGAVLDALSDQLNRVLLPRLWMMNGFDPDVMPFVQPGDLDEVDLDRLGNFVKTLSGAGAELFPNKDLLDVLLNHANLPVSQDSDRA